MKKTMAALAASALLAPAAALLLPISAAQAVQTPHSIRVSDFIPTLSDTRDTGSFGFGPDGLVLATYDTANPGSSQNKVAEYWAPVSSTIPGSASYAWSGSAKQPGMQIVFDKDQTTGNSNDYNVLVGEQSYSTNAAGQNLTDFWYTGGNAKATTAGITCPSTDSGGFANDCHGTLAQWQTAVPTARVYAYGFSLGSGLQGEGLLSRLTFGTDDYTFEDDAAPSTGQGATTTTTTTPAKPAKDVTGTVTEKTKRNFRVKLTFKSDATPTGFSEGNGLVYLVKVDGKLAAKMTQGANEQALWNTKFSANTGKHKITVYRNGVLVGTYKIKTA